MWDSFLANSQSLSSLGSRYFVLFAQEAVKTPAEGPASPTNPLVSFLLGNPLIFMIFAFVLFWVIVVLPQQRSMRKQQLEAAEALNNLRKNDRVVTTGGIHGTIVNVSSETGTVTIRVDEATNAKLTVNRDSVAKIFREESKSETGTK
jgi:preprotein translocase subunit YajC